MSAVVAQDKADTKTATPYDATTPDATVANRLPVNLWFSLDGSTFPESGTVNAVSTPLRRTVTYTSGEYFFPDAIAGAYLMYPSDGTDLYCVGLYPQSGWSANGDNTKATHAVGTDDDLMFAPMTSGDKTTLMGRQTYQHLLTWIKVRAHATSAQAIDSWGNVTSITIDSKPTVEITLADGSVAFTGADTPLTVFSGNQALTIASAEFGSVFCSPVVAANPGNEYTLHITCAHYSKDISVSLKNTSYVEYVGSTAGKVFVINLNFDAFSLIDATCTLTSWDDSFVTIYPAS